MAHTPETELRIERICLIMRQRWFKGSDRKRLAEEWELSEDRVSDLANEARKRVLAEVTDPDGIRLEGGAALRRIIQEGLRSDNPRHRANVIKAIETWARVMGADAPQKIDATVTGDDSALLGRLASLLAEGTAGEDPSKPKPGGEAPG